MKHLSLLLPARGLISTAHVKWDLHNIFNTTGPAATRLLALCFRSLYSSALPATDTWPQNHRHCTHIQHPTYHVKLHKEAFYHTWTQFNMTYCSSLPCLILEHFVTPAFCSGLLRDVHNTFINTFNTTLLFLHTQCSITYRVTHFMTIHNTITLYIFTHSLIWLTVWLKFHKTVSMLSFLFRCRQWRILIK